jgi:plasmid maintenance system antidote protein VapI
LPISITPRDGPQLRVVPLWLLLVRQGKVSSENETARAAISADTAPRLARTFGTAPEFWVDLQARYDLDVAKQAAQNRNEEEVAPRAA